MRDDRQDFISKEGLGAFEGFYRGGADLYIYFHYEAALGARREGLAIINCIQYLTATISPRVYIHIFAPGHHGVITASPERLSRTVTDFFESMRNFKPHLCVR